MNDSRIFSEHYTLRYRDVDMFGRWKPESIFILMQEISDRHTVVLNSDRAVLIEKGIVWVLSRMHVHMDRYPVIGDTLEMTTWPGVGNRFMFPRHYRFQDSQGNVLGYATSIWVLLDIHTRKSLPASALPVPLPDTSDIPAPLPMPKKLHIPGEALSGSLSIAPRFQDYDVNGHVNNTRYAAWFTDIPEPEYHKGHLLQDLQVNYSQEILPGTPFHMDYIWQQDTLSCSGQNDQSVFFQAQGIFVPVHPKVSML